MEASDYFAPSTRQYGPFAEASSDSFARASERVVGQLSGSRRAANFELSSIVRSTQKATCESFVRSVVRAFMTD